MSIPASHLYQSMSIPASQSPINQAQVCHAALHCTISAVSTTFTYEIYATSLQIIRQIHFGIVIPMSPACESCSAFRNSLCTDPLPTQLGTGPVPAGIKQANSACICTMQHLPTIILDQERPAHHAALLSRE